VLPSFSLNININIKSAPKVEEAKEEFYAKGFGSLCKVSKKELSDLF